LEVAAAKVDDNIDFAGPVAKGFTLVAAPDCEEVGLE
jgi:hypothetical protein